VEALGDSERGVLVSVTGLPVNADEPERPEICTALTEGQAKADENFAI